MSDEPQVISPRGVPPIRTDWLADVAQRLAALGLDRLRALGEFQHGHLTDSVDGEPWTFELMKFSGTDATAVEFDADLWAPADAGGRPSLRAGFALAPRWLDDPAGRATLVRTEIGPRAAVTFDPENWFVAIPRARPSPRPPASSEVRGPSTANYPRRRISAHSTTEAPPTRSRDCESTWPTSTRSSMGSPCRRSSSAPTPHRPSEASSVA